MKTRYYSMTTDKTGRAPNDEATNRKEDLPRANWQYRESSQDTSEGASGTELENN